MLDVSTKSWTRVGSLNQGRYDHAVVVRSNDFIIVGGQDTKSTERCQMQNQMLCVSVKPDLEDFAFYPEAIVVDENFCGSSESDPDKDLDKDSDKDSESESESSSSKLNASLLSLVTVQAIFL